MFDAESCLTTDPKHRIPRWVWLFCLAALILVNGCVNAAENTQQPTAAATAVKPAWGTYLKPFAANSLWNSRPVGPVLGEFIIPTLDYFPAVGEGPYSLGVFLAKTGDGAMTVAGIPGSKGVWDPDAEMHRASVTIPRWPPDAAPAGGKDGHADIVDPVSGIVHSFNGLKQLRGRWVAAQYAWTRIDGRGWSDPAHYLQGARAAGVPSMGGLIRKHEGADGDTMYRHALAVSLTFNALAAKPAYVFPATSADWDAATTNSGGIPEGTLLMLPESFNSQQIANTDLRKVVETLKVYGAYVVDRNHGTPFYIYVENGSGFNLHRIGWNNNVAADLHRIRQALRPVVSTRGWIDGNGRPFTPEKNFNLLSMRGPWQVQSGSAPGVFDTWAQAVVFPETATRTVQSNTTFRNMNPVSWAVPTGGTNYRLTAVATGDAKLRFQLRDRSSGKIVVDSNELGDGETATFAWPEQPVALIVQAISGVGQASSVRGELVSLRR